MWGFTFSVRFWTSLGGKSDGRGKKDTTMALEITKTSEL
jgi:hypothetical protein